jgi:hypothetical protein
MAMAKILDINRHDAHDRLTYIKRNQSLTITEMIESIREKNPFDGLPFYIFAHMRAADDGINKRLLWQPRLKKPKAELNSMLFKVHPYDKETVKIIWIIPDKHLWGQYEKGKLCDNQTVKESIHAYRTRREELEADEADDLSDARAKEVYARLYPNLFGKDAW